MLSKLNLAVTDAYERGYRISSDGRLIRPDGAEIEGSCSNRKYKNTRLNKKQGQLFFHKLAGYQKFGDEIFRKGMQVRHLDGNKYNNSLDNIGLGTNRENAMDIPKEERVARSLPAGRVRRKLTEEQVEQLRTDRENGFTYDKLQEKYKLARSTVSYIVNRKTYFA